jgi:hypothetical protein
MYFCPRTAATIPLIGWTTQCDFSLRNLKGSDAESRS